METNDVRDLLDFTYMFISNEIQRGELKGVRVQNLGCFGVKPYNKLKYQKTQVPLIAQVTQDPQTK